MNLDRLKALEEFARDDPNDPFNVYALALEYRSVDRARAAHLFEQLLADHPEYVPSYYHAGNFFWEQHESVKALEILKTGLAYAKKSNQIKAAGELQGLIDLYEE